MGLQNPLREPLINGPEHAPKPLPAGKPSARGQVSRHFGRFLPRSKPRLGLCCSFSGLVLGTIELALVLERAGAALFKAYKFGFDGLSPIILNRETGLAFFVAAALFLGVCLVGVLVSRKHERRMVKLFGLSVALNVAAAVIVAFLLVSPLARM